MKEIIIPAVTMGALGLVLGAILAAASKIFAVKTDERAEKIASALPGANCGSCGFTGCSAYAAAISGGTAKINCCVPGGQATADKIAEIMGVSAEKVEPMKAVVMCSGTESAAPDKYIYVGEQSCEAAARLQGGGAKACSFGCLGFGTCASVCKFGAISVIDGVAAVNPEKCGGCGECAAVCPKHIIKIIPSKNKIYVKCKSCDKGAAMKTKCSAGCIGCRMCEKVCPAGAIKVSDNCAEIDYSLCTQCGACAAKCPRRIIADLREGVSCTEEN